MQPLNRTHLLLSSASMHSFDFIGDRGRAQSMSILGPLLDVAEGHLLGQFLLALANELVMCFSLVERNMQHDELAKASAS